MKVKQGFYKKKNIFTTNVVSLDIERALIKSFVWIVALYKVETWTIVKTEKVKIEAFKICC